MTAHELAKYRIDVDGGDRYDWGRLVEDRLVVGA